MKSCLWISAAFFQDCISEQDLDEMNIEIIRNTLYKVKQSKMMEDGETIYRNMNTSTEIHT